MRGLVGCVILLGIAGCASREPAPAPAPDYARKLPEGRSALRLVTDPARMLLDLAAMRWRFRRGGYNPDGGQTSGED